MKYPGKPASYVAADVYELSWGPQQRSDVRPWTDVFRKQRGQLDMGSSLYRLHSLVAETGSSHFKTCTTSVLWPCWPTRDGLGNRRRGWCDKSLGVTFLHLREALHVPICGPLTPVKGMRDVSFTR